MSLGRHYHLLIALLILQVVAFAQTVAPSTTPSQAPHAPRVTMQSLQNLPQPAVPADSLELVTGSAQPVTDAAQRATIISLLSNSRSLSNVRPYPYDLKTSFIAYGSSFSDGAWQMENTSAGPGNGRYRWTAQGPDYSVVNLYQKSLLYSNQSGASMPLRLAQVRAALFYVDSVFGPHASIRITSASLNGVELTCALTERMTAPKTTTGGRLWSESEFCVDPKTGLLITYSPVPGLYVQYDYSNAIHFKDKIVPGKFVITEAGHTVVEASNDSVTDPPAADSPLFSSSGLTSVGVGAVESSPSSMRSLESTVDFSTNPSPASLALQIVIVHGMIAPDGHITESEILSSSDPNLNQRATDRLTIWQSRRFMFNDTQPGTSPQSHEGYFVFQFVVPGA